MVSNSFVSQSLEKSTDLIQKDTNTVHTIADNVQNFGSTLVMKFKLHESLDPVYGKFYRFI